MRLCRHVQPTFQRRAPVPCYRNRRALDCSRARWAVRFTTPGPASPANSSSCGRCLPAPRCFPPALTPLSPSVASARVAPCVRSDRPRLLPPHPREGLRLRQPGAPSIHEQLFSSRSPIRRLCRRRPVPGGPSPAAVTRFGLGRCPSARPRPSETSFDQLHSLTSATGSKYGHTRERPNPAPKRARERLVSLCSDELPRRAPQAARATRCLASLAPRGRRRADQGRRVSFRAEAERPARRALSTPWSLLRRPSRSGEPWDGRCSRGHFPLPTPRRVSDFEWPRCLPLLRNPVDPLGCPPGRSSDPPPVKGVDRLVRAFFTGLGSSP